MASKMTGKQRASRIPLDYYKQRDSLARWKLGLSGVALASVVVWMASGLSFGGSRWIRQSDRGRMMASHGPVARVHATWDARCEACHAPFRSISGEKWPAAIGLKPGDSNERCSTCHQVADHSAAMKPSEVGSCASCHKDHRGRDASLIRLDDAQCVACHGDLKGHIKDGAKPLGRADTTSFPDAHEEFELFRDGARAAVDPGTIKFNHALHMTSGLNDAKDGKPIFTVAQLSPADQEKYAKGQESTDAVEMTCTSCHTPDTRGAYYQKIQFQTDCIACHKLDVALAARPVGLARNRDRGGRPTVSVPHKLQPEAIREILTNASIGASMKSAAKTDTPSATFDRGALPGRTPAVLLPLPKDEEVAARVDHAERILFGAGKGTCSECHRYETPKGIRDDIPSHAALSSIRIEPAHIKTIWYEHASFDHSSHRGVSCRSCHEGAYADSASPSRVSSDVLLVGKATCAQCHAPASTSTKTGPMGGAGQSCIECHRYHGGGHGSRSINPDDGREIKEFLSGSPRANATAPAEK